MRGSIPEFLSLSSIKVGLFMEFEAPFRVPPSKTPLVCFASLALLKSGILDDYLGFPVYRDHLRHRAVEPTMHLPRVTDMIMPSGCCVFPTSFFSRRISRLQIIKGHRSSQANDVKHKIRRVNSSRHLNQKDGRESRKEGSSRVRKYKESRDSRKQNKQKSQKDLAEFRNPSRKSNGNFILMLELKKKILIFRDLVDLPPRNGTTSIEQLIIHTMKDLHKLSPETIPRIKKSEMKELPLHQAVRYFCITLEALGDESIVYECDSSLYDNFEKQAEIAVSFLDSLIKMAREKFGMTAENEEKKDESSKAETFRKVLDEFYASKSSCYPSSATPTSVLPEMPDDCPRSGYSSPLLLSLEVQAVGKLNAVDAKQLAIHMLSNVPVLRHLEQNNVVAEQDVEARSNSDDTRDPSSQVETPNHRISTDQGKSPMRLEIQEVIELPSSPSSPLAEKVSPEDQPDQPPKLSVVVSPAASPSMLPPNVEAVGLPLPPPPPPPPPVSQQNKAARRFPLPQPIPPPPVPQLNEEGTGLSLPLPASQPKSPLPRLPPGRRGQVLPPPPPPPPMVPSKGGKKLPAPPPMPTPKGQAQSSPRFPRPKKPSTKLKRSSHMGNLYRVLKVKVEGSSLERKSHGGRKSSVGTVSGGKEGMADALAEMVRRSSYFQQIEEDVQRHAKSIIELTSAIIDFKSKDMVELLEFHQRVESILENLVDETQVLSRFEGFPTKKLETLRTAAALYTRLVSIVDELQSFQTEPPFEKLLDKVERYFNKMKVEVDALERIKDEEIKKFRSFSMEFDFSVLVRIKEATVDVSSNLMELALKERKEAKAEYTEEGSIKTQAQRKLAMKQLWRVFQFAFRVYTFAGGIDERAEKLTRELAQEIDTERQNVTLE